jgi:Fe-S-cluster containining protein
MDELLPLLRLIDDRVNDVVVQQQERKGAAISCCKGCSACCQAQPVPVTPIEAYALWRLVEVLPEPRRSEVKQRFADRVQCLRAAGLADHFLKRDPYLTPGKAREIARAYFHLGLVCPFLESDACSIYSQRPFVCRQYLVTSPATLCRDPFQQPVQPVALPIAPATATLRVSEEVLCQPQNTVPLVLALEYAETYRSILEQKVNVEQLLPRWVQAVLSGQVQSPVAQEGQKPEPPQQSIEVG